eukprot:TRINITY_DN35973_c0_g1_i1.p1 TRINITY_DN35973_c0_g1~~TRINITY_DN35973_c0_g1_i1.p1  ORF type:complete len:344 (+),score=117.80 TRINITY_DN35973_c0_g1_i1:63-1094(+)
MTCAETIRVNLVRALSIAQQAVSADTEGDRVTALTLYEECSRQLEDVIPFVPQQHADVMARYSGIYTKRVAELKDEVTVTSSHSDDSFCIPKFTISFVPAQLTAAPPPETPVLLRRPFWLMKIISKTVQSGAMVTEELYIPRAVWVHDGAHLSVKGVVAKTKYCEQVVDLVSSYHMSSQGLDTGDVTLLCHKLDQLLDGVEAAWKHLQKDIPRADVDHPADQADKSRVGSAQRAWQALRLRMGDSSENKKTEPSVAYNSYLPWLVSLFESLQALDPIVAQFCNGSPSEAVLQRLHRLSGHLYLCLCSFVLKDMFTLLYRYMRRLRESFSRLYPKDFLEASKNL